MVYLIKDRIGRTVIVKKVARDPKKVIEINHVAHHAGYMNTHNSLDNPDRVPPRSVKLFDQMRERVRYLRDSLQTEKGCVY